MTDKQLHRLSVACGVITGLLLLAALQPRVDHDAEAHKQHCAMVKLWQETNGEYGWPDYNNTAHSC